MTVYYLSHDGGADIAAYSMLWQDEIPPTDCACNYCKTGTCGEYANCAPREGEEIDFFDEVQCGYGPWDTFVKNGDSWVYDHTLFCLTSVYDYYNSGLGVGSGEYRVVLSGNSYDWDPSEDNNTPECWYEIDPYSESQIE